MKETLSPKNIIDLQTYIMLLISSLILSFLLFFLLFDYFLVCSDHVSLSDGKIVSLEHEIKI